MYLCWEHFRSAGLVLHPICQLSAGNTARLLPSWRVAEELRSKSPIGICWIEEDGTIVVDLRRTADGINISMPPRRYPPTDPRYDAVLKHVGPLRPGEVKSVMPWPD